MGQRPRELTPMASPQHFWGAELREQRNGRGLSLNELGKLVHRDASYLAKIERGDRNVPADLARDCDRALDAGGMLVRLHAVVAAGGEQRVISPLHDAVHAAKQDIQVANGTPQGSNLGGCSNTVFRLPAPPRVFTGRACELSALTAALDDNTDRIFAIGGAGGIGKTWLALYWAHQNLHRFPDGYLYVNLRGFDPSGQPMLWSTAIRTFLESLGVDPASIPADPDAQAAQYHRLVSGKQMLILLDNARDSMQVIPLLPQSTNSTVLVTSRHRLAGLATGHGASLLDLDLLSDIEARDLLERYVGSERLTAEPDAIVELLASCAGLPLALSIVAARVAVHPNFPLTVSPSSLKNYARNQRV